jgi:hypothetical protein
LQKAIHVWVQQFMPCGESSTQWLKIGRCFARNDVNTRVSDASVNLGKGRFLDRRNEPARMSLHFRSLSVLRAFLNRHDQWLSPPSLAGWMSLRTIGSG